MSSLAYVLETFDHLTDEFEIPKETAALLVLASVIKEKSFDFSTLQEALSGLLDDKALHVIVDNEVEVHGVLSVCGSENDFPIQIETVENL